MVVEEAAAIVDELQLLDDFVNDIPNPQKRIFPQSPNSILFDELLDSALDAIPGLTPVKNPASNELNAEEEEELEWLSNKDAFPSLETSFESPPSTWSFRRKRSKIRRVSRELNEIIRPAYNLKRKCRHCEVEETPQWRMGPEGPKTLCNACGVRFKKGRLFPEYRPANSPKYSEGNYSNSTRRIIEMRMGTRKRGRPKMAAAAADENFFLFYEKGRF